MSKHYRQSCYDEDWMEPDPYDPLPPLEECICGRTFRPDPTDVARMCQRCLKQGYHEKVREYEPHE